MFHTARSLSRADMQAGRLVSAILVGIVLVASLPLVTLAAAPAPGAFERTWARTDKPVADGLVARTWMWGPQANSEVMQEPYTEAPGGMREVQYFDKARMEDASYRASGPPWDVTNGLLVVELITGRMQVGDASFEERQPAMVNVAGDGDDPTGPTYATFSSLLDAPARGVGEAITRRVDRAGVVSDDPGLAGRGITVALVDEVTDHGIAEPFWNFMNATGTVYEGGATLQDSLFENPYFATGRPVTEAYWAEVKVAGVYKDVLMQCFERRCLTYTPDNQPGWQVEAGNVGLHYYAWRYGGDDGNGGQTPETPESPATATEYEFLRKFGLPDKGINILAPSDVASAPNGDIYVTNARTSQVLRFNRQGILITAWGSEGSGNGEFDWPSGIAVDSQGNVYVVDSDNHRIQIFDPNGAFLRAFGGYGLFEAGKFNYPHGVAIGPGDVVYVTDTGNNRVQWFNANGEFKGVWDSGASAAGKLAGPTGIDVGPSGLVYVADTSNNRVQIFSDYGGYLGSFGQKGEGEGQFEGPFGVVAVSGATAFGESVYVTDAGNDSVLVFTPLPVAAPAESALQAVSYAFSHELEGDFSDPISADADSSGRIFIADQGNDRLQVFGRRSPIGGVELLDVWKDDSRGRFSFDNPDGIDIGPDGTVYAVDNGDNVIKVFSAEGEYIAQYGPALTSNLTLQNPVDVTVDSEGFLYIADERLDLVVKLNGNGEYIAQFGTTGSAPGQFQYPSSIALDDDGNIYVVDSVARRVLKFGPNFAFITSWDGAGEVPFDTPVEIAIHGQRAYVTNRGNAVGVFVTDLEGGFLGAWEDFTSPVGIDVDADGYVFVGDRDGVITKLTPDGEIVVEFGRSGSGDGQIDTEFDSPHLALDASGNVYVTDPGNQRIQVFQPVN